MKSHNPHRFSLLGLTILGASAFISTIIPSSKADKQINSSNNGRLQNNSGIGGFGAIYSCITILQLNGNCHKTATGPGIAGTKTGQSTIFATINQRYTTRGNTSISRLNGSIDTTSLQSAVL